jgi:hypothetical protein
MLLWSDDLMINVIGIINVGTSVLLPKVNNILRLQPCITNSQYLSTVLNKQKNFFKIIFCYLKIVCTFVQQSQNHPP